ncbi:hypothetical protein K501DRAFT_54090 [Backusella circina FSU 941]|nr:hypothetical protein K501DRAFT_54090 [Backusella circina FSU 941]
MSAHAPSAKVQKNKIKLDTVSLEDTGLPSPPQDADVFKERWCRNCETITTPRWRYGPEGLNTLCNACHLRWRTSEKKKQKIALAPSIPKQTTEKIQKAIKTLMTPTKTKTTESTPHPQEATITENDCTSNTSLEKLYCHTCLKTETPVWRSGPDGVRTQVSIINSRKNG